MQIYEQVVKEHPIRSRNLEWKWDKTDNLITSMKNKMKNTIENLILTELA